MDISRSEYGARLHGVRERMSRQGLSALLVSDPSNLYYLTGYNAWSFYTPQVLFVPAAGDLLLFARSMDAHGAFRTSWLPQDAVFGYPDELVHRAGVHPFDWVAGKLRELGVVEAAAGGQVGLELDAHFFSPKAYRSLVAALPQWTFVDSVELVNWVRAVKSPAEIELMRSAAEIATAAMTTAFEHVRVGARQCDVAAEISRAQIRGTAESGGDYPAIVPMLPTGAEADTPHLTWTDAPFVDGQAVIWNVDGSGRATVSDSKTRANPSIEDPSNPMPSSKAPSSSAGAIATDFRYPSTSVNHNRTNRMSRSSSVRSTNSFCRSMCEA